MGDVFVDIKMIKSFISSYEPGENLDKASDEYVNKYNDLVPEELIALWYNYGFGNYGDGIVKLVNADKFKKTLSLFLKSNDDKNIPFMITGFGDIYYFDNKKEIYLYNIHYKKKEFCTSNLNDFLKGYIVSSKIMNNDLKYNLFNEAKEELGELSNNDIYNFIPSLRFGGKEQVGYIQKADALISLNLLAGD